MDESDRKLLPEDFPEGLVVGHRSRRNGRDVKWLWWIFGAIATFVVLLAALVPDSIGTVRAHIEQLRQAVEEPKDPPTQTQVVPASSAPVAPEGALSNSAQVSPATDEPDEPEAVRPSDQRTLPRTPRPRHSQPRRPTGP